MFFPRSVGRSQSPFTHTPAPPSQGGPVSNVKLQIPMLQPAIWHSLGSTHKRPVIQFEPTHSDIIHGSATVQELFVLHIPPGKQMAGVQSSTALHLGVVEHIPVGPQTGRKHRSISCGHLGLITQVPFPKQVAFLHISGEKQLLMNSQSPIIGLQRTELQLFGGMHLSVKEQIPPAVLLQEAILHLSAVKHFVIFEQNKDNGSQNGTKHGSVGVGQNGSKLQSPVVMLQLLMVQGSASSHFCVSMQSPVIGLQLVRVHRSGGTHFSVLLQAKVIGSQSSMVQGFKSSQILRLLQTPPLQRSSVHGSISSHLSTKVQFPLMLSHMLIVQGSSSSHNSISMHNPTSGSHVKLEQVLFIGHFKANVQLASIGSQVKLKHKFGGVQILESIHKPATQSVVKQSSGGSQRGMLVQLLFPM